jgi:hypothetical protein
MDYKQTHVTEKVEVDQFLEPYEKYNVEGLNQVIRHQSTVVQQLEQLFEHHHSIEVDETTQAAMTSVVSVLQCIYVVSDEAKSILDDLGQKRKLTLAQFDLDCKFARTHNPDDDSMTSGPGIYE